MTGTQPAPTGTHISLVGAFGLTRTYRVSSNEALNRVEGGTAAALLTIAAHIR